MDSALRISRQDDEQAVIEVARKPLITMLKLVLDGQALVDMEHWELLQTVGATVHDCYTATVEVDHQADPDWARGAYGAQAVEHAIIYQGWSLRSRRSSWHCLSPPPSRSR
jgi:hypothetical protein